MPSSQIISRVKRPHPDILNTPEIACSSIQRNHDCEQKFSLARLIVLAGPSMESTYTALSSDATFDPIFFVAGFIGPSDKATLAQLGKIINCNLPYMKVAVIQQ